MEVCKPVITVPTVSTVGFICFSTEWKIVIGQTLESYLFPSFEKENASMLTPYRERNCLPNIISITCTPGLDHFVAPYPYKHTCSISVRNQAEVECEFKVELVQKNTFYDINRSQLLNGFDC